MVERFGPYRLVGLLGRGGMGEVYEAVDERKDRTVALKRLPQHLARDPGFQARFRREAELAARLSEPHIVPIHDYGEIDGTLFLDMRLVTGEDLATVLRRGPLPPRTTASVLTQTASALDAAHAAGLLHRDVKPSNILLTGPPGAEFGYLVDFGIAKQTTAGDGLTGASSVIGTVAYMAPERFDGEGDRRSDVYSLACVLFECLTGRVPFPGSTMAMMRGHAMTAPPAPSELAALSPEVDAVVRRGLAKDPADRYPTAGELAAAAAAALDAGPTGPGPGPGPAGPPATVPLDPYGDVTGPGGAGGPAAARLLRRERLTGLAAVLVTLALIVGSAVAVRGLAPGSLVAPVGSSQVSIGYLGDLSGPNAAAQRPGLDGARMAVAEYNATRPAAPVVLREYDTRGIRAEASRLVPSLDGDGVLGLVGPSDSTDTLAVGDELDRIGVPSVSPSATDPTLSGNGWRYWHRVVATDSDVGAGAGDVAVGYGARNVVVVDDGLAPAFVTAATERLRQAGIASRTLTTASLSTDATVLAGQAGAADVVLYGGNDDAAALFTAVQSTGSTALLVGGEPSMYLQTALPDPADLNDMISVCACGTPGPATTDPVLSGFFTRFRTAAGTDPSWYATEGYEAAQVLLAAIGAGAGTRDGVNEHIATATVPGVGRPLVFGPDGDLRDGSAVYAYQVRSGGTDFLGFASDVTFG